MPKPWTVNELASRRGVLLNNDTPLSREGPFRFSTAQCPTCQARWFSIPKLARQPLVCEIRLQGCCLPRAGDYCVDRLLNKLEQAKYNRPKHTLLVTFLSLSYLAADATVFGKFVFGFFYNVSYGTSF